MVYSSAIELLTGVPVAKTIPLFRIIQREQHLMKWIKGANELKNYGKLKNKFK